MSFLYGPLTVPQEVTDVAKVLVLKIVKLHNPPVLLRQYTTV